MRRLTWRGMPGLLAEKSALYQTLLFCRCQVSDSFSSKRVFFSFSVFFSTLLFFLQGTP